MHVIYISDIDFVGLGFFVCLQDRKEGVVFVHSNHVQAVELAEEKIDFKMMIRWVGGWVRGWGECGGWVSSKWPMLRTSRGRSGPAGVATITRLVNSSTIDAGAVTLNLE